MNDFDPKTISNLDVSAWERWVAYRISIKKALKPASLHAAALKLAKYGDDQDAVIEQSIANQWTGLFDLKQSRPAPGEKPKKSREQLAADAARDEWNIRHAEKSAHEISQDPIGALRMMDAILARLMFQQGDPSYNDKFETFRHKLGEMIAGCDALKAFGDPHIRSLVLQVYGERGINRLKARAGIA
jgi:hypothetical protein